MAKVALITDQHFGVRNDNLVFHDYYKRFYHEVFFPYLHEHGIKEVVDLGDTFDRRKYINFHSLELSKKYYFDYLKMNGITLHMIIGNHDTYFRDTNRVNSPALCLGEYNNIRMYEEPTEYRFGKTDVLLVPWICDENYQQTMDLIKSTKAQVAFGHLELAGFEMYRGAVIDHGLDYKVFDGFDMVCSGHFHHKSSRENIHYLGAPYEMVWSDFDDPRGFHVFDTDTRQLTYIQNPLRMFAKIHYDDTTADEYTFEKVSGQVDISQFEHMFVKVVVQQKNNPYWFDQFIEQLEKTGVSDLQVVEDHLNLDLQSDNDIGDAADDTLSVISSFVEQLAITAKEKKNVGDVLSDLYHQASQVAQV